MDAVGAYEGGDLNLKATELTLGLPGTEGQRGNKRSASSLSTGSPETGKRSEDAPPPAKSQIVGWPPVRSYRKNVLQEKKTKAEASGMYVKVSMDGAPYLRKTDLNIYKGYGELLKALEDMFKFNVGQYSEREGYKGSDYKPTYEDKDGDWMLVGDVPWEMFMSSFFRALAQITKLWTLAGPLTSLNWYFGNNRSMLVSNCLFRMGGAAILLSNRPADRPRSKYQLIHTVRTHRGADGRCYNYVFQEEDANKEIGVALSKDLMAVAGEALKTNITTLGPLVLQQLLFFATLVARMVFKTKIKPYIPDFKLAFEHFCIHAGGRAVLDELEKNLDLSEWHMEPSRMTLYRFGNTSSSSLWYELAYTEAKGRIHKGDRTWQIAFGSGFKCNSAVWKALKTINPAKEKSPWIDEIQDFPVNVPRVETVGAPEK